MSHFSVIVITNEYPTDEILKKALMPYHEFECTGINEYIENVDMKEEAFEEFKKYKTTIYISPEGEHIYPWNEEGNYVSKLKGFYDSSERDLRLPEGWSEIEDFASKYITIDKWIPSYYGYKPVYNDEPLDLEDYHKFGWVRVEGPLVTEVIKRTNPNSKWDWYSVGGRYKDKFISRETNEHCDIIKVEDIDFETLNKNSVNTRKNDMLEISEKTDLTFYEISTFITVLENAHEAWKNLPEPRPRGNLYYEWLEDNYGSKPAKLWNHFSWSMPELNGSSVEEYIERAPAITCWAILKDGEWKEKGSMGWFGMASGEAKEVDWQNYVNETIVNLPKSSWLTTIDCHI